MWCDPARGILTRGGSADGVDGLPSVFKWALVVVSIYNSKARDDLCEVGKTTTTANVGLSLTRLGFSVVAIDADIDLRNLDLLIGLENHVNYTAVEVLNDDCHLNQALVRDKRWSRRRQRL
ncbi:hypothetical protein Scep_011324 [Stephania cephalantha]|uniref:CobQ/CobB/MinD/ParA nucleotide binding domain-containing protein n=1 Tax=Stephania cephalantha TaxID=152367 RepID=A0AAP0JCV7_9MAGN